MISREELTRADLVDSLYSRICPACGDAKREEDSFCYSCYSTLPAYLRNAVHKKMGEGYEPAMHQALTELGAEEFHKEA